VKLESNSRRSPITKKNKISAVKNPISAYPIAEKTAIVGKAWGYTCAVLATGEIVTSSAYFIKTNGSPNVLSFLIPITLGSGLIAGSLSYGAEKLVGMTPDKKTPKWVVSLQQSLLAKKHKPKSLR
jgi:hypothetical protein